MSNALYVIVDHANNEIATAHTIKGARNFIRSQNMTNGWFVKLYADWKKKG